MANHLDTMMARAHRAGVTHMVSCATMEENFDATRSLADRFPGIIPCFGIHPWFIGTRSRSWEAALEKQLAAGLSGIGETGLDFMDKTADREDQIRVFGSHLVLAKEMNRPINVHVRKAWDTFIGMIRKMGPLPAGGLIHSYSGSADMIPLFEKYNWHISFSGSITRPNAKKAVRAVQAVSPGRMLLETDSPDIVPTLDDPLPGMLNEPSNLPGIAQIAAARRGEDCEALTGRIYENSMAVFGPLTGSRKENSNP